MVNFFFSSVHHLLNEIQIQISVSNHNMKLAPLGLESDPKHKDAVDQATKGIVEHAAAAERLFVGLKCAHIDGGVRKYRNTPQNPFSWSELNTRARALRDAIETELRDYLFYQYPKQKGQKLLSWRDDWKAAIAAFPSIHGEVFDAIDCYALQHNTASVFHSMRIAEYGLRALAKERKIRLPRNKQIEWATWQEILKALDDEIKIIGGKRAGAAKDAALEFYSGARADLNGFKDEYRNLVMHVRASYDEHQALRALTNIHGFIERMAAKIDHQHHRIRWGFR